MGSGDDKRLGLCLVGLGRAGSSHLAALATLGDTIELVAIADEIEDRAVAAARKYGIPKRYRTLAEAMADPAVEAIDICLPNDLHRAAVVRAAEAGRHVIVEKPLANTVADADAMIAAADRAGVTLMVGQSRRFFPCALESHRQVTNGAVGRVIHVHAAYFGLMEQPQNLWWKSAARAGGLMLPLWGSHILDYILWIFGKRPRRVYMEASNNNPNWEGEDELVVTLGFDGGGMASAIMSWNARPVPKEKAMSADWGASAFSYERFVVGTEGTLQLRDERELFLNGQTLLHDRSEVDNFAIELREFADAVREGRAPISEAHQVRPVVEVMEACRLSAAEGRVVELL
ncbi:MAG: Gfo/Idh/MocA family protein [Chloroflexota bacterium]